MKVNKVGSSIREPKLVKISVDFNRSLLSFKCSFRMLPRIDEIKTKNGKKILSL